MAPGGLQLRGPALQFLGETKAAVPVALRRQISGEAPCVVRPVPQVGRAGELRRDDPVEIAFELSALSHGLIVLYLGGRVAQSEKEFRALHQRSVRRYLDGLRR